MNAGDLRTPDDVRLAVVSDGSDFCCEPGADSLLTELTRTAASVREQSGVSATALLVTADSVDELADELRNVADDFSAFYLVHTDATRGRAVQLALRGTVSVITDRQSAAIAVTAAVLIALFRAGVPPASSHVVIAGAARNPMMAQLVAAAGIGEISSWNPDDAHNFPLCTLARRADVVVDLLGNVTLRSELATLHPALPVIALDDPTWPLLTLPGLLAEAPGVPAPGLARSLACARVLACAPTSRRLPVQPDPSPAVPVASTPRLPSRHLHPVR